MQFSLIAVNTEFAENHPNKSFNSMSSLLSYVAEQKFAWTSLYVTVFPESRQVNRIRQD